MRTSIAGRFACLFTRARIFHAAWVIIVAACGSPPPDSESQAPVATITLSPTTATLMPPQTLTLVATLRDSTGAVLARRSMTWLSDAPAIATVDSAGLVTPVTAGTATISVSSEGKSASTTITVSLPTPPTIKGFVPNAVVEGSPGLSLVIVGRDFAPGATAQWNGVARPATYVSPTQLLVSLSAADIATERTVTIAVTNPGLTFASAPRPFIIGSMTTTVAVGTSACALRTDGHAYCWGPSGTEAFDMRPSATPVPGPVTFKQITNGFSHSCAIGADDAAYCWGAGEAGQLGVLLPRQSGLERSEVPVAVSGGLSFSVLSAGNQSTCGLTKTGAAYCWGAIINDASIAPVYYKPAALPGGLTFVRLSLGHFVDVGPGPDVPNGIKACALTAAGKAYCWGGGTQARYQPVAVPGNLTFIDIASSLDGGHHDYFGVDVFAGTVCGIVVSGTAYCWGRNGSEVPVAVPGGQVFQSISAGEAHTCALTTAGEIWCWGQGASGRLGQGVANSSLTPVKVGGGLTFRSVSAGVTGTCGVTTAGAVYCWGDERYLGDGSNGVVAVPTVVSPAPAFVDIAVLAGQSCGLTAAHVTYCWGSARMAGDPGGTDDLAPQPLPGSLQLTSLYSSPSSICGLTGGGAAYCWGYGINLEFTSRSSITPIAFSPGTTFSSLALDSMRTCGITSGTIKCASTGWIIYGASDRTIATGSDQYVQIATGSVGRICGVTITGDARCAGDNPLGALGRGTSSVPASVLGPVDGNHQFKSLTVSDWSVCGVEMSGSVLCWGSNPPIGYDFYFNPGYSTVPSPLAGGGTFNSFLTYGTYACGVRTDQVVLCMGDNAGGTLGSAPGGITPILRPVSGPPMTKIALTRDHVCGLTPGGVAYCWGARSGGQLGDGNAGYAALPAPVVW